MGRVVFRFPDAAPDSPYHAALVPVRGTGTRPHSSASPLTASSRSTSPFLPRSDGRSPSWQNRPTRSDRTNGRCLSSSRNRPPLSRPLRMTTTPKRQVCTRSGPHVEDGCDPAGAMATRSRQIALPAAGATTPASAWSLPAPVNRSDLPNPRSRPLRTPPPTAVGERVHPPVHSRSGSHRAVLTWFTEWCIKLPDNVIPLCARRYRPTENSTSTVGRWGTIRRNPESAGRPPARMTVVSSASPRPTTSQSLSHHHPLIVKARWPTGRPVRFQAPSKDSAKERWLICHLRV